MSLPTFEATHALELTLPEVQKGESVSESDPVATITSPKHDEPVVTRRELGSYYRVYHSMLFVWFSRCH
jgi:hypothetical protein